MNAEQKNQTKQARKTIIEHLKSPERLTTYQITTLALELSRKPDGAIDTNCFEQNCDAAFEILTKLKSKLEQNANLSTE